MSDFTQYATGLERRCNELEQRIAELEFEVDVLRRYGNKDCTWMADEQIAKKRAGLKCDFED